VLTGEFCRLHAILATDKLISQRNELPCEVFLDSLRHVSLWRLSQPLPLRFVSSLAVEQMDEMGFLQTQGCSLEKISEAVWLALAFAE
jgi:hypothetical protein